MQQSQHTQASVLYRNTGLNPIAETEPMEGKRPVNKYAPVRKVGRVIKIMSLVVCRCCKLNSSF